MKLPVGLPLEHKPPVQEPVPHSLFELEREHIIQVLKYTNNNKARAAKILGISLKSVFNKLHEHGLFERYARPSKPVPMD